MSMEQKNTNPIDIKVNNIIETCKRSMKMYRITNVQGEVVYLEHFYTKAPVSISLSNLINNICGADRNPWTAITITNPSALNNKLKNMPERERKEFLNNNDNIYSIPDFENSDKISASSNQNKMNFNINKLLLELKQGRCLCLSNPMALAPYLNYYLANFEKDNIFKFIAKSLLDTFIDYNVETSGEITDSSFRFRLSETDNKSEQATTIYLKRQDNIIAISGKRNNLKLDLSYSIRNIGQNQGRLNKLIYKMHIDICLGLKLTPFRYVTSYPYLNKLAKETIEASGYLYYLVLNKKSFQRNKIITDGDKTLSTASVEIGFFTKPYRGKEATLIKKCVYTFSLDFNVSRIKLNLDKIYKKWTSNDSLEDSMCHTLVTDSWHLIEIAIKGEDGFKCNAYPTGIMSEIHKGYTNFNDKIMKSVYKINNEEIKNILLLGYKQKNENSFIYNVPEKEAYLLLESLGNHKYAVTGYVKNEVLMDRKEFTLDFEKYPSVERAVNNSGIGIAKSNFLHWLY